MSYIAEQQVIGALMIDQNCIDQIYDILESDMFTSNVLGSIYREYQRAYDTNTTLTMALIEQRLKSAGFLDEIIMREIQGCVANTVTSIGAKENAIVIRDDYRADRLNKFIHSINVAPSNLKSQIGAIMQELEVLQDKRKEKSATIAEITKRYKDGYFKEREIPPINLGFDKIDDCLGGLEGGDLIIIGARPAVGKSAFVTQIALNLARQGKRVGFYNLEMKEKQMYERFVVSESGIGLTRLRRAIRFMGDEQERFDKANEVLEKQENIIITSDGGRSVADIRHECKHMDYDVIIVDYLQLLSPDKSYKSKYEEVGAISKALKNLAMELNIPIIALSQLNRVSEGKETKEPSMSELREAGNIEQDASVIILMWNITEDDKTKKGCKVEKNRQGTTAKIVMKFDGEHMKFVETDETVKEARSWKNVDDDNPFS